MRDRLERAFAWWGYFAYRHAGWVLTVVLALTAALGSQLPKLGFDTSIEAYIREDDPVRLDYDEFRALFGMDTLILIAVRPPQVFDLPFLEELRAFHYDLEAEVPMLREVTSLVNARETRGEGDELVVGELMEDWPETADDVAELERRAMASSLYRDQLLSRDGHLTAIVLEPVTYSGGEEDDLLDGFDEDTLSPDDPTAFLSGPETAAIVDAVYTVMNRYRGPDFEMYVSGSPVMMADLEREMTRDMGRFTLLAVGLIVVLLGFAFRRTAGVVLPLFAVIVSVVQTMSLMALLGIDITSPTQILPSFLLAVGVGGAVHIMAIFYQARRRGGSKGDAIAYALGHSGLAVLMTSLTTAGGLLSFTAAAIAPVADFGVMAPAGVMLSLLTTLAMLPAMIALFPMRDEEKGGSAMPTVSQRMVVAAGRFATRHAVPMIAVWTIVLAVSLGFASQVRFSHAPFEWFPEGHPTRKAADVLNDEMSSSMFVELLVDTGRENRVQDPELLRSFERIEAALRDLRSGEMFVGKTLSVADVVQETHQALNENRPEFYAIPDDPALVAQELLLFENSGSDDLEDLVDSQFRVARFTVKMPFLDAVQFEPFFDMVGAEVQKQLDGRAEFTMTGLGVVAGETISAGMRTLASSYMIAFAIISPLLILLIGNLRLGMAAIVPNLTPIVFILGVMGALGLPIDSVTLMIGSIALGLAVDDTIHFMHNFRRYFARSGDVEQAVVETLSSTGQALLLTTLVLSTGFFVYFFSTIMVLHNFGLLTAITIVVALLADVLLAPALMTLVAPPKFASAGTSMESPAPG